MKRFLMLLLSVVVLGGCSNTPVQTESTVASVTTTEFVTSVVTASIASAIPTTATIVTTVPEPEFASVDIVCAGDNLIHSPIYMQAKNRAENGDYDFLPAFENVRKYIEEADLAILNQETIVSDKYEPSNFPYFCSPEALARDMITLGFDAVSISNNHCLDKGEEGLIASLEFWADSYPDIPVYGAYLNEEDMNNIRILEVNGITFAFLGFMEHTNGLMLPENSVCELTYMSEEELIEKQIKEAEKIADCVIVSVHFGVEVTNEISVQQYDFSQKLADYGADIIIGTQPHTIQSMEYLTGKNGNKAFVFYCLGNFISAMDNPYSMVEMLGRIKVTKSLKTGEITLSEPNAVPLINHYDHNYSNIRIYPFSEYTEELGTSHGCKGTSYSFFERIISENIPEEYLSE